MNRYFDTGLLVKLYVAEPNTAAVLAVVRLQPSAMLFTSLHELELKNAIRAKLFRREISAAQSRNVIADVETDVRDGVLRRLPLDWHKIHDRAETLSTQFTPVTGCRTLDILHVAAALEAKTAEFCTGDQRQAKLARLAGLRVTAI